jgi:hypothetical protein
MILVSLKSNPGGPLAVPYVLATVIAMAIQFLDYIFR